ncbi:MAG TPA: MFS transporter [Gaiellaceae bacterium]|nr:MFS transporter [Gaiellaceae bacterium]
MLAIDTRPLRESRDFRLLWCGQAVSYVGNMVTFVAVPFQLYSLTGSPLQVGLLSICDAVPLLLLAALGGTIADRFDRRKLVFRSEVGLMVVSGLLAVNAFSGDPQVWALYVLAAAATSLWAIGAPALRALMPGLVPEEQLAASQALQSIYGNTAAIAGPALGGLLIAAAGIGATYAIDVATFVASLVAVYLIAPAPPKEPVEHETLESLREGWRFLVRQRVILGTFVLDTNAMVFGMPQALFPGVAAAHFDAGARAVGLLYAAPAVGALAAALASGWIAHVRRQGVAVAAAIVLWGAAIAGFGFATALWLGLAMLAIAGLADEYSAILRSTILFSGTPDGMRGRMQGFELAQVASTPAIGNVEAGVVASLTSLRFAVVSGGIACAVGAVAILAAIPSLIGYVSESRVTGTVPGTHE